MDHLTLKTTQRQQIVDLTPLLVKYLAEHRFRDGLLLVYSPHTTAGISVNENADPSVKNDITRCLSRLVPQDAGYSHAEGNADAHIKGSLINFSQTFMVENGKLLLGTWQGVFFMEFDGPRRREVWLKFVPVSA